MKSLGTLLVKNGWISKQQLGLAISKQREIGGRLGTCLLELGAISEELLDRCLGEQQAAPVASASHLSDIAPEVTRRLPPAIAIRYRAVPFRAGSSGVDVAMLEIDNLWLQDELSFIVGQPLNVFIANEARVVQALTKYYGAPCSERFVKLLARLEHDPDLAVHPESRLFPIPPAVSIDAPVDSPQESTQRATQGPRLVVPQQPSSLATPPRNTIPMSREELAALGAQPATASSPTGKGELQWSYPRDRSLTKLEDVETRLEQAGSAADVATALEAVLSREFIRFALLKVASDGVRGWRAGGPGLVEDRFADYHARLDEPSIFLNLREGGSFFLGQLPEMPVHLALAACWDRTRTDECVVVPVRIRSRLVALLYGDRGPIGLSDFNLDGLRRLATFAAEALERCLVAKREREGRSGMRSA